MGSPNKIEHFTDLDAWKLAHQLTISVYSTTQHFPKNELFGLTGQLRRAASSIGANIAEGMGRGSFKDRLRFFYNSRGSLFEIENHILLAKDLSYVSGEKFDVLSKHVDKARRTLNGLITATKKFLK